VVHVDGIVAGGVSVAHLRPKRAASRDGAWWRWREQGWDAPSAIAGPAVRRSITLAAPRGSVYVRGEVESGDGGQGGFARATGNAGLIFAEGGGGGPAGRIIVQAGDVVDVTNGTLRGGAAGNGGWAIAQVVNAPTSIPTSSSSR
jgi:hypothetical protein